MAGPAKGKTKKNKGKFSDVHKPDNKQQGTSSSNVDLGLTQSKNIGGSRETGKKSSPPMSRHIESMLEELLKEKVELLYKKALEKFLDLGYGVDIAIRAILMNGSIFGGTNILSNISSNALDVINKGYVTDDKIAIEPIFDNVLELARFSMQTLINKIVQDQSNVTNMDAILYLLQSDSLAVHVPPTGRCNCEDHKHVDKSSDEIDIGKMLMDNTASLQGLYISATTQSSSVSKGKEATFDSKQKITNPCVTTSASSSDAFESDGLEFMKSLTNCPDGVALEDLLRTCPENLKEDMRLKLVEQLEKLTIQVKES